MNKCVWVETRCSNIFPLQCVCVCVCVGGGGGGGRVTREKPKMQIITMPTTSDTTRAEPKNFLIHLNVRAALAALPPCESPQAAKRPLVSHLFTRAAAGCHWDSEGEIPWFSLPFVTAPAQTTLIRDRGARWWRGGGGRRQAWAAPAQDDWSEGSGVLDVVTLPVSFTLRHTRTKRSVLSCCYVKRSLGGETTSFKKRLLQRGVETNPSSPSCANRSPRKRFARIEVFIITYQNELEWSLF